MIENKIISVERGDVAFVQQLNYKRLYNEKPYPDAVIWYFSNGVYRIVSEGEDHYGVYTRTGNFTDDVVTIRFISFPSIDWGNKTAYHKLTFFNNKNEMSLFTQQAINERGELVEKQYGYFTIVK
ncbi:hypothetical protein [Pantoea agglomerans]